MRKDELLLQSEVVSECRLIAAGIHPEWPGKALPCLDLLRCSLNGMRMKPRQVIEAKASGMVEGEPDLFLPAARDGYAGLFVEMKVPGRIRLSEDQKEVHALLRAEGYRVEVCWDRVDTVALIVSYVLAVPTWCRRSL